MYKNHNKSILSFIKLNSNVFCPFINLHRFDQQIVDFFNGSTLNDFLNTFKVKDEDERNASEIDRKSKSNTKTKV